MLRFCLEKTVPQTNLLMSLWATECTCLVYMWVSVCLCEISRLHQILLFNRRTTVYGTCILMEMLWKWNVCLFLKMLQVYNKVDQISIEEVDRLARQSNSVVISCGMKLNLDYLLEQLWEYLALICLYTKKRGGHFWIWSQIDKTTKVAIII